MSGPTDISRFDKPSDDVADHANGTFTPENIPGGTFTNITLVAGRAYIGRFVPRRARVATGANFAVGTAAGSNDSCDVAIYNSTLTTRLTSSGATAGKLNATGVQTVSFTAPVNLLPGNVYYIVFSVVTPLGSTAAQLRAYSLSANELTQLPGATEPDLILGLQSVFPIAGSLAGMSVSTSQPVIFLLAS